MQDEAPKPYAKDKIGSHLSYPLKFSEILSALSPAIEQLPIVVSYNAWKAPRQNELRTQHRILATKYRSLNRYCGVQWSMYIYPLPRPLRPTVRTLLTPETLDRLRHWFLDPHSNVWLARDQELEIVFDCTSETLVIKAG